MNTKPIPAVIMLLAGAVTCITTYLNGYSFKDSLVVLLTVLILFLFLGSVIKGVLDSFQLPDKDEVGEDGEVIEKQPADGEEESLEGTAEDLEDGE